MEAKNIFTSILTAHTPNLTRSLSAPLQPNRYKRPLCLKKPPRPVITLEEVQQTFHSIYDKPRAEKLPKLGAGKSREKLHRVLSLLTGKKVVNFNRK